MQVSRCRLRNARILLQPIFFFTHKAVFSTCNQLLIYFAITRTAMARIEVLKLYFETSVSFTYIYSLAIHTILLFMFLSRVVRHADSFSRHKRVAHVLQRFPPR